MAEDLDEDGLADLVMTTLDAQQQTAGVGVFRNAGGGQFTQLAVFPSELGGRACALADFDGDGRADLVIVNSAKEGQTSQINLLRGDASRPSGFADDAPIALPAPPGTQVRTIGAADLDSDGLPDLYLGLSPGSDGPTPPITCDTDATGVHCHTPAVVLHEFVVLHNEGPSFSLSAAPSATNPGLIMATAFYDLNGDGYLDILELVDFGQDRVYLNEGGTSFTDSTDALGMPPYNNGMGAAVVATPGPPSIYVGEIGPDEFLFPDAGPNAPYANLSAELGIAQASAYHSAWGPVAEDFNNDGTLDLVEDETIDFASLGDLQAWAQIFTQDQSKQNLCVLVLENLTDPAHRVVNREACRELVPDWGNSVVAVADFDGDGQLDAVIGAPQRVSVLMNRSDGPGHWLEIRLRPRAPHTALGATIKVFDGDDLICERHVGTGGSRATSWSVAHCGLGTVSASSHIEVDWLGRSAQVVQGPVSADQVLIVSEP